MSLITLPPESFVQKYEWTTDVLVSVNGNEQRIPVRQVPRQNFSLNFLADSNEEIQYWRYELFTRLDDVWVVPLWPEAENTTSESMAGGTTIDADFTLMDDSLGPWSFLIVSPDYKLAETVGFSSRTSTTLTISGTLDNTYPAGSWIVPVQRCLTQNNSGYNAAHVNAATIDLQFQQDTPSTVDGKGSVALTTHKSIPVLDRRPEVSSDAFNEDLTRLDYGHKTYILSEQTFARIISTREFLSTGNADRQWWKLFLTTIKGRLKPFYCSTYRPDMTIDSQPDQGASTIDVLDDATVAGGSPTTGWENSLAHTELVIDTADGDTQYVTMTGAVDNGDGTHTITITPALTNTIDGSTILNISFLELSRLGSDTVQITHKYGQRIIALTTRTIQA